MRWLIAMLLCLGMVYAQPVFNSPCMPYIVESVTIDGTDMCTYQTSSVGSLACCSEPGANCNLVGSFSHHKYTIDEIGKPLMSPCNVQVPEGAVCEDMAIDIVKKVFEPLEQKSYNLWEEPHTSQSLGFVYPAYPSYCQENYLVACQPDGQWTIEQCPEACNVIMRNWTGYYEGSDFDLGMNFVTGRQTLPWGLATCKELPESSMEMLGLMGVELRPLHILSNRNTYQSTLPWYTFKENLFLVWAGLAVLLIYLIYRQRRK